MTKKLHILLFGLCLTFSAFSQRRLLSPSDFLPHTLGEQFTRHHQQINYFEYVAEISGRVKLVEYGRTNEQRPLKLAIVTLPMYMDQLETIRTDHLKRAGLLEGEPELDQEFAIVWLSFGVHGNEAGAPEAAMNVLYELVNGTLPEIRTWLENTIVILDPCINPDGYDRYTGWYRGVSNLVPDPNRAGREHREPWPGGRVNHYYFDLNRDWAWATQVETQQRLKWYRQWMPHIHGDYHEQFPNDNYYFAPAAEPFHFFISDWQREFQNQIGLGNVQNFDQEGWMYYTREIFDLLYPSYGDTYPIFNGAIGMTFEQAGHGISGRAIKLENGDILTLDQRIERHTSTALNNIEKASENVTEINENFAEYFANAKNDPPGKYKTFIIPQNNPTSKLQALTHLLDIHGIDYGSPASAKSMTAFSYRDGVSTTVEANPGDLVISAHQPQGILTQVLFEPETQLYDSLTYDITAWALPYAYGLEAYASEQRLDPNHGFKTTREVPNDITGSAYAYLANWRSTSDARLLTDLLQAGLQVRFAEAGFTLNGIAYPAGTLMISRNDNRKIEDLDRQIAAISDRNNNYLTPVYSGYVDSGRDLGSGNFTLINAPKVLVLSGEQIDKHAFGQVWHYFEQTLAYPLTVADVDDISRLNLSDFNLIVMPGGSYSLDEAMSRELQSWMRDGGRLIAIGNALRSLAGKEGFSLQSKDIPRDEEDKPAIYAERGRSFISRFTPGAIIEYKVDSTHPLGFGLNGKYFSLKTSGRLYEYLDSGWTVGHIEEDPLISGFIGSDLRKELPQSLGFGVENKGRGAVIYLVDNPLFRAFWQEGQFLFSNAVFLAGQ